MPRKDRTFSDSDVIRILTNNLERREKIAVLEFFGLGLGQDIEPPKTQPLPRAKTNKAKIEVEVTIQTIERIKSVVGPLSLLPGPQKGVLDAIHKSLDGILTILELVDRLLT
jgi:hypothetical protein